MDRYFNGHVNPYKIKELFLWNQIVVFYWSFVEKTSVMQDPNTKWAHIFRWNAYRDKMFPPTNRTQSYRAQLHRSRFSYSTMHVYPGQTYPLANQTQSYRAWLHWSTFSYSTMHIYPGQTYPPPMNWTQSYRAQLHWSSFSYSIMHIYPGQIVPPCKSNPELQGPNTLKQFLI